MVEFREYLKSTKYKNLMYGDIDTVKAMSGNSNKTYSILELDSIKDFNQSSFKVGFGTASSMFMKNSFPNQYAFDFETMSVFKEFDQTYNTEIRYVVFETSMVDQISELHEQIDRYILMLEEYVGEHVQQIKKELIQKQMEEHS